MLDREQRELLVVPYTTPPAPRRHLIAAAVLTAAGALAVLGLAMADYSPAITAWLIIATTLALFGAVVLFVTGVRVRRQFRSEMERGVEAVPVQPAGKETTAVEAV